jgi:large subunit ribosomal protein L15
VNLSTIQEKLEKNLLDPTKPITIKHLVACGAVGTNVGDGIKLLAKGDIAQPVNIEVTRASERAISKVEAKGGSVTVAWYNRLGLRALLKPYKFDILPRFARPPPKYMEYYTSNETRGYLSPLMQMKKLGLSYTPVVIEQEQPAASGRSKEKAAKKQAN